MEWWLWSENKDSTHVSGQVDNAAIYWDWNKEWREGLKDTDEFTFESVELSFLKTFNYYYYQHIARHYAKCYTWIILFSTHNNPIIIIIIIIWSTER